jgi:hypothetical protein
MPSHPDILWTCVACFTYLLDEAEPKYAYSPCFWEVSIIALPSVTFSSDVPLSTTCQGWSGVVLECHLIQPLWKFIYFVYSPFLSLSLYLPLLACILCLHNPFYVSNTSHTHPTRYETGNMSLNMTHMPSRFYTLSKGQCLSIGLYSTRTLQIPCQVGLHEYIWR